MKKILHLVTVTAFFFSSIFPASSFAFNVNVVQGNATVNTSGNTVTINAAGRAILQGNINIPSNVTVKVVQGLNDILLRDTTGSASNILGSLLSNGNIILVNSIGVYIGQTANINVGGLIASTLDIKNAMFMNGDYQFTKIPGLNPAQILNEANIKVANGGYAVLLADSIVNKGTITAYMGTVALGSGQQATLSFDQGGLVNLVIDQGLAHQLTDSNGKSQDQIVNTGGIYVNGGKVQMTAKLLGSTLERVINNTGIVEANNVVAHGGTIELTASGAIDNSGIIQAGTMNEQGETLNSTGILDVGHGFFTNLDDAINISGSISGLYSDTGNINFTGAVSLAGDSTLQADDTGSQTGEVVMNTYSLTGNNFNLTLYTGVNDTLDGSISGVNLLTLNSSTTNNKTFTSTGTTFSVNTLKTNYYSLFSRSQGSGTMGSPYMIYSDSNVVGGLQYIPTESLSAYYQMANNIDASETSSWNSGAGFVPIGTLGSPFTGTFNGNNYTIANLFIDLPSTNFVGLFGHATGATISNTGLINADVTGHYYVGALVGNIDNPITASTVSNSYTTGSVTGAYVGGLVGESDYSSITNSYSTASVSGSYGYEGGLVGFNDSASISNSYATGAVSGGGPIGGLVGLNRYSANITDSYATGSVTEAGGNNNAGGLVGYNANSSSVISSFATGSVSSSGANIGGLIGYDDTSNTLTNNWWYNSLSNGIGSYGPNTSTGNWEKASAASDFFSSSQAVYTGTGPWDISSSTGHTWAMSGDNDAYPLLQFRYSTTITDPYQLQLMFLDLGASYNVANNIDATETSNWNAGNGFAPVGSLSAPFTGTFNGNNYTIANLFIDLPSTNFVGLFGHATGATISNTGLINADVTGHYYVGALVGNIDNPITASTVSNSYTTGSVTGAYVGGLVGESDYSSITNSYSTASVSGSYGYEGGLVGFNDSASISNSYATGAVSGGGPIGGLVGLNRYSANITDSYATGSVTEAGGNNNAGGLVGYNANSSSVISSFATGSVSSSGANIGGLIGYDDTSNTLTNNWWYNSLSNGIGSYGPNTSTGNWEKASAASDFFSSSQAVYTGTSPWDFSTIWYTPSSADPLLR